MLLIVEIRIVVLEELYQPFCIGLKVNFHDIGIRVDNHTAQLRLQYVQLLLILILFLLVGFAVAVVVRGVVDAVFVFVLRFYCVNLLRVLLIVEQDVVDHVEHHSEFF